MPEGITFDGMNPILDGTWYNPTTGDSFTVKDTFFEDNNLLVMTTDGRQIGYNTIQHYIKSDKPIKKDPTIQQSKQPQQNNLPAEVAAILDNGDDNMQMLPDDAQMIMGNNTIPDIQSPILPASISDASIIERAIGKSKQPKIDFKISWADMPAREMDMLISVMNCKIDDIVEWELSKIDTRDIMENIRESVAKFIKSELDKYNKPSKK